jgi:hypothetical protein
VAGAAFRAAAEPASPTRRSALRIRPTAAIDTPIVRRPSVVSEVADRRQQRRTIYEQDPGIATTPAGNRNLARRIARIDLRRRGRVAAQPSRSDPGTV